MKTLTYDSGGYNAAFCWGYIYSYNTTKRIIWVAGYNEFTKDRRAVIDNFGDLVGVKS